MAYDERRRRLRHLGECAQGHLPAGGRTNVDGLQRLGAFLKVWPHLQDDSILVQLREDRGHQPLSKGIVQRVVNELRGDAQP